MPHLIIEYTHDALSDAQVPLLLDIVHHAAMSSGLFEAGHIKTRVLRIDHYRVGNEDRPFIHAQLRMKAGRTTAEKKALSEAVLAAIHVQQLAAEVITVEVVDMDVASYSRYEA
jgi:5-carboxymethyl-2-hydroxymuconate isomerase